jgi:hypothetical protein
LNRTTPSRPAATKIVRHIEVNSSAAMPSGIRNALPTRSIIIKYQAIRNEIGNVMAVQAYGRRDCGGHYVAEVHLVGMTRHENGTGLTIEARRWRSKSNADEPD